MEAICILEVMVSKTSSLVTTLLICHLIRIMDYLMPNYTQFAALYYCVGLKNRRMCTICTSNALDLPMGHDITGTIRAGWVLVGSTRLNRLQQRGQMNCVRQCRGRGGSLGVVKPTPLEQ